MGCRSAWNRKKMNPPTGICLPSPGMDGHVEQGNVPWLRFPLYFFCLSLSLSLSLSSLPYSFFSHTVFFSGFNGGSDHTAEIHTHTQPPSHSHLSTRNHTLALLVPRVCVCVCVCDRLAALVNCVYRPVHCWLWRRPL